jgi:starch phosphorylase
LEQKWAALRFGEVKIKTAGEQHIFEIQVYLNGLDPKTVSVELYADAVNGVGLVRKEMKLARQPAAADGVCVYSVQVPASRPATDYTARVIPHYDGVSVPLEEAHILWQR